MATTTKSTDEKDPPRPRVGLVQFVRQVRQEVSKVTWPTRREWLLTTMMVFIMVFVATLFFLLVDSVIAFVVKQILAV